MTTILRAPHSVPSLFGQGVERDVSARSCVPLPRRLAAGLARLRRCSSEDVDAALARLIPALVFSSATLLLVGRPLVRAASLAIGMDRWSG